MITYTNSLEQITVDQLQGGFFVGWPNPPSPATHLKLLNESYQVWLAMDGDEVVGFMTAISDGVLTAFIPLLEVLPAYQGHGIGSELSKRMLESLSHLYSVDLMCDPEVVPFYERQGMRPAGGMIIRNYQNQAGIIG